MTVSLALPRLGSLPWTVLNEIGHGRSRDWKVGLYTDCSQLCSLLWTVVLHHAEFWLTTPFPFHSTKGVCDWVFCCFHCYSWNLKNEAVHSRILSIQMFFSSLAFSTILSVCSVDTQPSVTFSLIFTGDLISWLFLRMVHSWSHYSL